jgi:2-C-methyl-D-erythritol 2,4-cyclodiphosphate synthase
VSRVHQAGWRPTNVDCIVLAQEPKLSAHKEAIRRRIAELLGLAPTAVGIKAKTGEGVGPVGRREAIEAQCVVLIAVRPAD